METPAKMPDCLEAIRYGHLEDCLEPKNLLLLQNPTPAEIPTIPRYNQMATFSPEEVKCLGALLNGADIDCLPHSSLAKRRGGGGDSDSDARGGNSGDSLLSRPALAPTPASPPKEAPPPTRKPAVPKPGVSKPASAVPKKPVSKSAASPAVPKMTPAPKPDVPKVPSATPKEPTPILVAPAAPPPAAPEPKPSQPQSEIQSGKDLASIIYGNIFNPEYHGNDRPNEDHGLLPVTGTDPDRNEHNEVGPSSSCGTKCKAGIGGTFGTLALGVLMVLLWRLIARRRKKTKNIKKDEEDREGLTQHTAKGVPFVMSEISVQSASDGTENGTEKRSNNSGAGEAEPPAVAVAEKNDLDLSRQVCAAFEGSGGSSTSMSQKLESGDSGEKCGSGSGSQRSSKRVSKLPEGAGDRAEDEYHTPKTSLDSTKSKHSSSAEKENPGESGETFIRENYRKFVPGQDRADGLSIGSDAAPLPSNKKEDSCHEVGEVESRPENSQ